MSRPEPFTLIFAAAAQEAFPRIREALAERRVNRDDRDAFVLVGAVGALLRELVPADAPTGALERHVALLHHAYRYWEDGRPLYPVDQAALDRAVRGDGGREAGPRSAYLQLPERRAWAEVEAGSPPQPLDGVFLARPNDQTADLLAVFGLHPSRSALTVVPVAGPWDYAALELAAARPDATPLFASRLPGGREAGLISIATAAELLLLARRLAAGLAPHPARR